MLIDKQYILVLDENDNCVGKFEKEPDWELNLPSDLSVEATDKEALSNTNVNWDNRILP